MVQNLWWLGLSHSFFPPPGYLMSKKPSQGSVKNGNEKKIIIFLSVFLNIKSKHITKGAQAQIEKKQEKITFESISLENSDEKKQILNQSKRSKCILLSITNNL